MKKLTALLLLVSMLVCTTACKDKTPKTIIIDDLELDKTFSYENLSMQISSKWDFNYVKNDEGVIFRCPDDKGRISFSYDLYDDKKELETIYNEECQHYSETATSMQTIKISDVEINMYEWASEDLRQKNYVFMYDSKLYIIIFIVMESVDCSIYTNSDEIVKTMTLN